MQTLKEYRNNTAQRHMGYKEMAKKVKSTQTTRERNIYMLINYI